MHATLPAFTFLALCTAGAAHAEDLKLESGLLRGIVDDDGAGAPTINASDDVDTNDATAMEDDGGRDLRLASNGLLLPPTYAQSTAGQTHTQGGLGLGLQVGSPTAFTLKLAPPMSSGFAFGIGAGFGYGKTFNSSLWLHADYLFHLGTLIDVDGLRLGLYGGPGVFATFFGSHYGLGYANAPYFGGFDAVGFGLRLPLGIALVFDALPLELYGEFDPAVGVFPGIGFGIGASLGFRFYL